MRENGKEGSGINFEKRTGDRRARPTPAFSRYVMWGRRRNFRRWGDRERGGYVDRHGPGLWLLLILTGALNLLDALLTATILEHGGSELNPLVASVIELLGSRFWIWKLAVVSAALLLLGLHSKFKFVRPLLKGAGLIYGAVVAYQLSMIVKP